MRERRKKSERRDCKGLRDERGLEGVAGEAQEHPAPTGCSWYQLVVLATTRGLITAGGRRGR